MPLRLFVLLVSLSVLSGCGDDAGGDDAGVDAAMPRLDAGGGGADAGDGTDAGGDSDGGGDSDAGQDVDGGATGDGGVDLDGGADVDAGSSIDAGANVDAGGRCAVDCDCPQTQRCIAGACRIAARPFYCCDTPGCPAGMVCTDSMGTAGTCPAAVTDCARIGGTCVAQFSPCPRPLVRDTSVSCGPVRSLECCRPSSP